jgi:hypothetical protein
MSEIAKTLGFFAVGAVAIVIGFLARPASVDLANESLVDTVLTKDFKQVEDAKALRIVRYDENTGQQRRFEVAEENGLWTIPSKQGYPADAAEQMAAAATALLDRKILRVASRDGQDHEQFGVIDPESPKLEPGQEGVGTRVTLINDKKEPLVDLIVGKAVKDAEGQRFVREAGRDAVYVIEIDRSKLSTNFEDWIEKDLLKLQTWDLQQVDIKDYSAALQQVLTQEGIGLAMDRDDRGDYVVGYDDGKGKWEPIKLASFDRSKGERGEYVEFKLAPDEELNEESLNGLKTALGDLKIVDVVRKPDELREDLKRGSELIKNEAAFGDLLSKGFTAMEGPNGAQDIACSDGEVIVTLKNGCEYVLRFGNITNVAKGEKDDSAAAAAAAEAKAAAKTSNGDVHRYMFVMARQNKDAVKQPDIKPLPELPKKEDTPAADAAAAAPADATPATDAAPADATKTDAAEGEEAKADPAAPDADTPPTAADDASKANEAKQPDDAAKAGDTNKVDDAAKADDAAKTGDAAKADEAKSAEDAKKADPAASDAAAAKDKELEKIMAERKRIEDENQRKNEEYQALLKKGDEQVKQLNLRFGDWYFVVDDSMFKKLRLGRNDIIKKKAPPAGEAKPAPGAANPFPATGAAPTGVPAIPGATQ